MNEGEREMCVRQSLLAIARVVAKCFYGSGRGLLFVSYSFVLKGFESPAVSRVGVGVEAGRRGSSLLWRCLAASRMTDTRGECKESQMVVLKNLRKDEPAL